MGSAQLAEIHRLHAINVLLVGRDRRFLRVAEVLLERDGCRVESAPTGDGIVARLERGSLDVVVLDASNGLTAALRTLATLEAQSAPVGVVLVADRPPSPTLDGVPVLPKWDASSELFTRVEAAYNRRHFAARAATDVEP